MMMENKNLVESDQFCVPKEFKMTDSGVWIAFDALFSLPNTISITSLHLAEKIKSYV